MTPSASPPTATLPRDWLTPIILGAWLLLLAKFLFPNVSGPSPGAAKRAQAEANVVELVAALKQYHAEYGAMPTGNSNAVILASLRGTNPKRIVFIEFQPEKFNARGQLIDPWGTPYQVDVSNPAFPWAYSFGRDARDNGGAPDSDDIVSWR